MLEEDLRRVVDQRKISDEQRRLETSKIRLKKIIKKKITTAFIGAIAKVEEFIGTDLWGHGLPDEECTPEQLEWRDVWEDCRTEILNGGNGQVRATESELNEYTVRWNAKQTKLSVVPPTQQIKSLNDDTNRRKND